MGLMDTSVPFVTDENGNAQRQPLNDWYRNSQYGAPGKPGNPLFHFYAQSVSSPSRASIMTGQNAPVTALRTGSMRKATTALHTDHSIGIGKGSLIRIWIYPYLLQQAGYKTIHVGKAHFGCLKSEGENPTNLGFDVNIAGSAIGHPGSYHGEKRVRLDQRSKSKSRARLGTISQNSHLLK